MADGEVVIRDPQTGRWLTGNPGSSSEYTPEIGERIAELVSNTSRGVQFLCQTVDWMPDYTTIWRWQERHQDFARLMEQARRRQALTMVDECMEIADDASHDRITIMVKGEPREIIDLAGIARAKIRIDTRIKVAKMFDPARFGDKLDINARVGGFASQDEAIDDLG